MQNIDQIVDDTLKYSFSADRPINSRAEDLLQRSGFAESLALAIAGWKGNDSLVIALYGPWGSGKSSIKNMVLESLRGATKGSPQIVDFNPWQWAGQDQLAEAFFQEIGIAFGKDSSKEGRKRSAKWRAYGTYLKTGSFLFSSFPKIIFWFLVIIGLVGFGGLLNGAAWIKPMLGSIVIISWFLAGFLKWGGTLTEHVTQIFMAGDEVSRTSLPELKEELTHLLRNLKKPILVVIDDVDRLSMTEVKLLFQLVKANADFPNLVYLLLFQRDIVERSLKEVAPITGREFLEKIVQVGFDIPRVESTRLEKVLFAGLDRLLADKAIEQRFNQLRWGNILIPGLRPYFKTLRDVHRFLATFSFHVSLFLNHRSSEVNPIDLIALEVLRVFEPEVYHQLYQAKSVLTEPCDRGLYGPATENDARRIVETIVNHASQNNRPQVREILKQLFPPAEWVFGGSHYSSSFRDSWFRDLRVCHPDVFDRYFCFTIPEGDISQTELDLILSLAGDREGLATQLRFLNRRGLLGTLLNRIDAYKEEIDLKYALPFVTALFDIGDELPDEPTGLFSIGPDMYASRIIHWYLKKELDVKKRGRILKEAIEATNGLYLPILKTSFESKKQERGRDPDAFLIDEDDVEDLQKACITKIRQAAESGVLKSHRKMAYILYRWRDWTSLEEPKRWVESLVESEESLLCFLTAFLKRTTSQGMEDYVARIHWRISLKEIEDFISADVLEKKTMGIALTGYGDKEQRAIRAFQNALKRRREGKSDDDWRDDDDE